MSLEDFIRESNAIERIFRNPLPAELRAYDEFLGAAQVHVPLLEEFVQAALDPLGAHTHYEGEPGVLRRHEGMNVVIIGVDHPPPRGGPTIERRLEQLLRDINEGVVSPWHAHLAYETLHPFIDGNGRSGRALWAWQMQQRGEDPFELGFLHRFYYDTLSESREGL